MREEHDEYFNNGIFEVARSGRSILMKNNMTEDMHTEIQKNLKEGYSQQVEKIEEKISEITNKVLRCNPIDLLTFSADTELMNNVNIFSETDLFIEENSPSRPTEYIQSIYVSLPLIDNYDSQEDQSILFLNILKDIEELHCMIQRFYYNLGEKLPELYPNLNDDVYKILMEAQMMYIVRGKRYQIFEVDYLEKLLFVHDDVFQELFHINSEFIIDGLKKLQFSLTQEKLETMFEFIDFFDENLKETEDITLTDNSKKETNEFIYKAFGTGLRNVIETTNWPEKFVRELSWKLNDEEVHFFDENQFSGWPVVDLPVFKRPFIEVEGSFFCFDYYSFVDNFYRVIQKTVTRLKPQYNWNDKQQIASEKMVENIFKSILPNCLTFTSNYYPINNSRKNFAENDLIVIYYDTLIIVEIKAGSFVYTAPMTDFDAHIKSYKSLVEKPDLQCERTKQYLTSGNITELFDSNYSVKAEIDMSKINNIYEMTVTIDNINTFASKAEKLSFLNLKSEAISIAIDDLMVYDKYFDSPLIFLHFLQQRKLATQEPKLALDDELDHLGMYIEHNCYSMQLDKVEPNTTITFLGYREAIDSYFNSLYHPKLKIEKPFQKIPDLFLEIINYLDSSTIKSKSKIANYLLNFSSKAKEDFCENVSYVLNRQKSVKYTIPYHAHGYDEDSLCFSCFINQVGVKEMSFEAKRNHLLASLLIGNDKSRTMLDLYFDETGSFQGIKFLQFQKDDIKDFEKEKITLLSQTIAQNRVNQHKQKISKKIGRNEICPCGSGLKYKRCCGK